MLLAAPAMAAELPISAPVYAPAPIYGAPPIIALNWTGCYLGGHIGGSFTDEKISSTDVNSTGLLAGGQVGCNLQFAPNWVVGIEADASGVNQQGGGSSQQTGILPGITTTLSSTGFASAKTDFIATATGRLGYTFGRLGQGMVYAKGGAAWAHDTYQFNGQVRRRSSTHLTSAPLRRASAGLSARVWSGQCGTIGRLSSNMITWILAIAL